MVFDPNSFQRHIDFRLFGFWHCAACILRILVITKAFSRRETIAPHLGPTLFLRRYVPRIVLESRCCLRSKLRLENRPFPLNLLDTMPCGSNPTMLIDPWSILGRNETIDFLNLDVPRPITPLPVTKLWSLGILNGFTCNRIRIRSSSLMSACTCSLLLQATI